jgi:hypothetical protein
MKSFFIYWLMRSLRRMYKGESKLILSYKYIFRKSLGVEIKGSKTEPK